MSESSPERQEPTYVRAEAAPARSGGNGLGLLSLLLSLLALGAAGYLFYRTQVTQQLESVGVSTRMESVKEGFDGVKSDVEKLDGKVIEVRDDLAGYKNTVDEKFSTLRNEDLAAIQKSQAEGVQSVADIKSSVTEVKSSVTELSGSMDKVYEKVDRSLGDWQLQEVEQLMRTANDRLTLAGDIDVATSALTFADQRIVDLDDPGLSSVRTALADELRALDGIEKVDVVGIANRLRALQNGVAELPLRETPRLMGTPEEEAGVDNTAKAQEESAEGKAEDGGDSADSDRPAWLQGSRWKSLGKDVLKDLAGTVKVQKSGEARPALMSPDQRFFLHQNLNLQLNSAQLSLLKLDEDGFKQNIQTSRDWVDTYFVPDAGIVVSTLKELDELSGVSITQELPDISGSLSELRKIIQARAAK